MKRAYRFRFYPTYAQADLLNRTFGCVRKVYNLALEATRSPSNPSTCHGPRLSSPHRHSAGRTGASPSRRWTSPSPWSCPDHCPTGSRRPL
ncbi:helix-turn-helix domain-containing protein [Actinoplanes sp. NPDC024001]|uniref:helix-turn-helix domain-containing protein n=1 Tax=Actinoplanes sp. NPDC024001 TaxID=3154598 RepID=UPI0033C0373B